MPAPSIVIEYINKIQPKTKAIILSAYEKDLGVEKQLEKIKYYGYVRKSVNSHSVTG
jgi:hypothetical protein